MGRNVFATADQGSYKGGSRTFTIYNKNGDVLYNSGSDDDLLFDAKKKLKTVKHSCLIWIYLKTSLRQYDARCPPPDRGLG